jgi:hypothetical protein
MSLKTWKAEFYKTPANRVSKKNALQHSLTKWTGLLKNNLKKHGVFIDFWGVVDKTNNNEFLGIDVSTCALCYHYQEINVDGNSCLLCPLYGIHEASCDANQSRNEASPYLVFCKTKNPKPMIALIQAAIKAEGEKAKKQGDHEIEP